MITRRRFLAGAAAVAAVPPLDVLEACGSPPPPPAEQYGSASIVVAAAAPTAALLPIYVADKQGYFTDAALSVSVVEGVTAPASLKKVVYAEAQVVVCDASVAAPLMNEKGNLIGAASLGPPGWTLAARDAASAAALGNGVVAACSLSGLEQQVAAESLIAARATGSRVQPVENRTALLDAVRKGQPGLVLQPDAAALAATGIHLIALPDTVPAGSFDIYADRAWVNRNRSPLVRFLRALLRANSWLADGSNRGAAAAILGEQTGTAAERCLPAYDAAVKAGTYARALEPDLPSIRSLLKIAPEGPFKDAGSYFDTSVLREARTTTVH